MKLLTIFIVASIINVVIQTVKSIATVKCGKWASAIINAVAYGFYTWVVVLTVCDLDLWTKIIVTAVTNFIGVWVVKWIEEKARKDKLWLVKMTIPKHNFKRVQNDLDNANIPYSWVDIDKYVVFDTYCSTQRDTTNAVLICKVANGKIFATENKLSL